MIGPERQIEYFDELVDHFTDIGQTAVLETGNLFTLTPEDQLHGVPENIGHHRTVALWNPEHPGKADNPKSVQLLDKELLRLEPHSVPGLLGEVDLYVEAGLKRTALTRLERAVAAQPTTVALLRALAGQLRALGRDTEAAEGEAEATATDASYEYEPSEEEILADLLPRNLAVQIYRSLLESFASEQGARMTAMDNATRNAGDMINSLTTNYNRTRQAFITKELIEIISGAEAL